MSAAPVFEKFWDTLVSMLISYALRKYGRRAVGFTIHLDDGSDHREPLPAPSIKTSTEPPKHPALWKRGPLPKRGPRFEWIYWPGEGDFSFPGEAQSKVVARLWEARDNGEESVSEIDLLDAAGSSSETLRDLFKGHPAWGRLIIKGPGPKTYTFPPVPEEPSDE